MTATNRTWFGREVIVMVDTITNPRRPIGIALTEEAADSLLSALTKGAMSYALFDSEVNEIRTALEYVLKGTERAKQDHDRMEAGKGMEPSGG
jgi:hypothetical protein